MARQLVNGFYGNAPTWVISDIMMPVLDGFGLLKKIRSDADVRNTPVVFLSARAATRP